MKLISLTSDFGVQSQSVGVMEAVAAKLAPAARVLHLMHGLPPYNILAAARTLEAIQYVPVGNHVCVCDPGVGTDRRAIVITVGRGDHLIGPDNGVLIPATRKLGGILAVNAITNARYMLDPVSRIFHGRDIFVPAAAHLSNGVKAEDLGPSVRTNQMTEAPYNDAEVVDSSIYCSVIQINYYGSLHLNMTHEQFDGLRLSLGIFVTVRLPDNCELRVAVGDTFGDVEAGQCVILKDDYGRVELAINRGSFSTEYGIRLGDSILISV